LYHVEQDGTKVRNVRKNKKDPVGYHSFDFYLLLISTISFQLINIVFYPFYSGVSSLVTFEDSYDLVDRGMLVGGYTYKKIEMHLAYTRAGRVASKAC